MDKRSIFWQTFPVQMLPCHGNGIALREGMKVSPAPTPRRQRGFTLLEVLIVVALVGFLFLIVLPQIGAAVQRARLDSRVTEIRTFLLSAYTTAGNESSPVVVRLETIAGQPRRLRIARNPDGTGVLAEHLLPEWLVLSTTDVNGVVSTWPQPTGVSNVWFLQVDPMGRTLHPETANQVTAVQNLVLTHRNMVAGRLRPRIRYQAQVFPIWQVQVNRAMW